MNKNTKKTNLTGDNTTFIRSVSRETKDHFDNLLKQALHREDTSKKAVNDQNSKIKKLQKYKTGGKDNKSDNESDNVNNEIMASTSTPEKGNFILEKFLTDAVNSKKDAKTSPKKAIPESSRQLLNSVTFIKPPVPLPRKIKNKEKGPARPISSQGTYSISSPVLNNSELEKDIERLSICSRNTYDITEPKFVYPNDDDIQSNASKGTYNIYKPDNRKQIIRTNSTVSSYNSETDVPVGDIIIHNKSKRFVKVVNKRKHNNSTEDTSKIHYESEKLKLQKEKSKTGNNYLTEGQIEKCLTCDENEEIELEEFSKKSKNKKDKKKVKENLDENNDELENSFKKPLITYEDFIGVVIYKTDKLLINSLINHPCVKVHIVDSETGEYLARSREIQSDTVSKLKHIYPQITKSYELQKNRTLIPYWEELVVFNEDFDYILEHKDSIIIFFEILDFLSFSAASSQYNKEGSNSGWHKIAWAFLKLVSKTGQLNTEQMIRLQLYKPKRTIIKISPTECALYDWWARGFLSKYPSTLHVSVKKVKASSLKETTHSDAVFKSELNLHIIDKDIDKSEVENEEQIMIPLPNETQQIKWSRMPNQSCKIPNKVQNKLKTMKKGCFVVKFSNNGLMLACGVADDEKHPIIVYSVLEKQKEFCKFAGHQGIIYHLHWSSDDKYLISSSADCTVYIWNVFKKQYYPMQVLPHPSFVYCSLLNQEFLHIITGCYDQVIRIWRSFTIDSNYELLQELEGHEGYITSLCFGENKNVIYSSDSVGIIIEWNFNYKEWVLKRTLKFKEFEKTVINNLLLHPGANRMLVFCRDSTHRMVDLSVGCVIQWYRGVLNYRVHTNGALSPCGNLVFAPSEDGSIFVWNTDTGTLLASYNPYSKLSKDVIVSHCISYHPLDHIIAFCHYGSFIPILFCTFDNNAAGSELQLKDCTEIIEKENVRKKSSMKESKIKFGKSSLKKRSTKSDNNSSFDIIIDKIDDVLVSAKSN